MNKTALYIFLGIIIAGGTYLSIITINALTFGGYSSSGFLTETKLAILLAVFLFISMLAFSAIIYNLRKNKISKK